MVKRFGSANLRSDGTVEVKGPFSLDPGDPQKPAQVAFYLVQTSTDYAGAETKTVVEGSGSWSIGDTEWTGTCAQGALTTGTAHGYGMAILVQNEPPGFATWTWTSSIDVTDAPG